MRSFSESQRQDIFERDDHRCVVCGLGLRQGETLFVDFVAPGVCEKVDDIVYGATYCARHCPRINGWSLKELVSASLGQLRTVVEADEDQDLAAFDERVERLVSDFDGTWI